MRFRSLLILFLLGVLNGSAQDSLFQQLNYKNHAIATEDEFEKTISLFRHIDSTVETNDSNLPEEYLSMVNYGLDWANRTKKTNELLLLKYYKLRYYSGIKNENEFIKQAIPLLENEDFTNMKESVNIMVELNNISAKNQNYHYLLELTLDLEDAHKKFDIQNTVNEEMALRFYALAHFGLSNYDKAMNLFEKLGKTAQKKDDLLAYASQKNNIGLCYIKKDNWDSATLYFNRALNILAKNREKIKGEDIDYNNYFAGIVKGNLNMKKINRGQFPEARKQLLINLKGGKKHREYHIVQSCYYYLAQMAYKSKTPSKGLHYLDSLFAYQKKQFRENPYSDALSLAAKCYLKIGNFKRADSLFERHERFGDSLKTNRVKQNFIATSTLYEVGAKNLEINKSKATIKAQEKFSLFLMTGSTLLGLAVIGLFFLWNKSRQSKIVIDKQNIELKQSLHDKEVLMKEIHHRVKNNLQVISAFLQLQSDKISVPEVKKRLTEAENNIHSMITVHQLLYENNLGDTIYMDEYLTNLVQHLKKSNPTTTFEVAIEAHGVTLNISKVVPIGLILTELFTNTSKYAFPEKNHGEKLVNIELQKNEKGYCKLLYSDNGIGVGIEELQNEKNKSIGSNLVELLAEEMDATLNIENNNGLIYNLNFQDKILQNEQS